MLKFLILGVILFAGTDCLELVPPSKIIKDVKIGVNDAVGGVVGTVGTVLTEIPLSLAQGMKGTGDWLAGIVTKTEDVMDTLQIEKRKTLLDRYNEAVLSKNPEATMRFPELARKYGYPVEQHEVKTDDGYMLTIFRIPHGARSLPVPGVKRPVVFLMHGLIMSADDWILMGPEKSLGYMLADAGYDVWFGNVRGNMYSRKHVSRSPKDSAFWDYSWDEIGRFDLPAMIDYALEKTGESRLYYAGHSQGTTSFFVMCSMRPEYNAKIRIMFALSPVAWMTNAISPMMRILSPGTAALTWVIRSLGTGEMLPSRELFAVAGGVLCKERAITQDICGNTLFISVGFDLEQLNTTMLPVILGHDPAGSSVGQFVHYGQGMVSKDFRRYDYGPIKNKEYYGTLVPPSYDVSKITAPVSLLYSSNDWLSHTKDVDTLSKKLGNVVDKYLVPFKKFNHIDFLWAIDVDKLINERVINMMKKY